MLRRPTLMLVAAAGIAALSACAPPAAEPGTTAAPAPVAAPPLTGPGCLVGDWMIEQDQLQVFYDSVAEASGGGIEFTVDGDTGLSFDGDRYVYTPDLSLTLNAGGVEGVGVLAGTIEGTYTAADSIITTTTDTTDVSYTYSVGGVPQDASSAFAEALQRAPISGGEYECTDLGPLIQFDNGFGRVPVQLTR
jgi:hypothetical protein